MLAFHPRRARRCNSIAINCGREPLLLLWEKKDEVEKTIAWIEDVVLRLQLAAPLCSDDSDVTWHLRALDAARSVKTLMEECIDLILKLPRDVGAREARRMLQQLWPRSV